MFLKIEPQQYKRKKESLVREDEEMNPQLWEKKPYFEV